VIRTRPLALAAALLLLAVAGCTGPGGGGGGTAPGAQPEFEQDPWLTDDLEVDSVVVTSELEGKTLLGMSCDLTEYLAAETFVSEPLDNASVTLTAGGSSFGFGDPGGTSAALGADDRPPTAFTETVSISGTGFWHIGDGGANDPWAPSAVLNLTQIPIPEDGCSAADMWYQDMFDVETDAAEVIRAFSEDGLRNVSEECPDLWSPWVPPNLTCEEFEARTG
jgi:hypothetical protein